MRSIKDFSSSKLLGKWVSIHMDRWEDSFYCVGESQDNIYLWYGPTDYEFGCTRVHKYAKVIYDVNENPVSFHVSRTIPTDSLCFGWDLYSDYKELDYNLGDDIKWIK